MLVWLLLLSWISVSWTRKILDVDFHSGFWKDQFDVDEDKSYLNAGQNLVYFLYGDVNFGANTADDIVDKLNIKSNNRICFSPLVNKQIAGNLTKIANLRPNERKLVLIRDVEGVEESTIRGLDFIFRLTDSSSTLTNLVILLMLTDPYSEEEEGIARFTERNWRDLLSSFLNSNEKFFDGAAATGRISRAFIQRYRNDSQSYESVRQYCQSLPKMNSKAVVLPARVHARTLELNEPNFHEPAVVTHTTGYREKGSEEIGANHMDFMSFLALLSIPIIIFFVHKRASAADKRSADLHAASNAPITFLNGEKDASKTTGNYASAASGSSANGASTATNGSAKSASIISSSSNGKSKGSTGRNKRTAHSLASLSIATDIANRSSAGGEDSDAPPTLLASGDAGTPVGFDVANFRADYHSNNDGTVRRPYAADLEEQEDSDGFSVPHSTASKSRVRRHSVPGDADSDEDGSVRQRALRMTRLSYGSTASAGSSAHLNNNTHSANASPSPVGSEANSERHNSNDLVTIDIDESVLPVRRRGRKSKGTPGTDNPEPSTRVTRTSDGTIRTRSTSDNTKKTSVPSGRSRSKSTSKNAY